MGVGVGRADREVRTRFGNDVLPDRPGVRRKIQQTFRISK